MNSPAPSTTPANSATFAQVLKGEVEGRSDTAENTLRDNDVLKYRKSTRPLTTNVRRLPGTTSPSPTSPSVCAESLLCSFMSQGSTSCAATPPPTYKEATTGLELRTSLLSIFNANVQTTNPVYSPEHGSAEDALASDPTKFMDFSFLDAEYPIPLPADTPMTMPDGPRASLSFTATNSVYATPCASRAPTPSQASVLETSVFVTAPCSPYHGTPIVGDPSSTMRNASPGPQGARWHPLWSGSDVWHAQHAANNAWPQSANPAPAPAATLMPPPPDYPTQPAPSSPAQSRPALEPLANADADAVRVHKLREEWLERMNPECAPHLEPRIEKWLLDYMESTHGPQERGGFSRAPGAGRELVRPVVKPIERPPSTYVPKLFMPLLLPESNIWSAEAGEGDGQRSWPSTA
ncbi:hypothetical protein C8Q74DRAFT_1248755 [Fomes fomentarius]|nr:hypothetical protein C8Q74DRAFT_1248755 [Fomes fomentarius]